MTPERTYKPREKLLKLSNHIPQLWVVAYVGKSGEEDICQNAENDLSASIEGGAHAAVFINEHSSFNDLDRVIKYIRKKFPETTLGVNYLGDEKDPYGYKGTFTLAKEYNLQIAWTDFSGVDLIKERPRVSLHDIEKLRPDNVFYCSGVHMKYSTLLDPSKPLLQSAFQAMGFVDGILITGPITGTLPSPQKVAAIRAATHPYPLGIASGLSAQNANLVRDHIDFALAASSLWNSPPRISKSKVEALFAALS